MCCGELKDDIGRAVAPVADAEDLPLETRTIGEQCKNPLLLVIGGDDE
jgi:hypothetical protein